MTTTPRILADEPDALVVFKPGGWSTHDAGPASHPTLSQWLIENRWHEAHPVHRLDKPTSGIVLVGKTPEARTRLSGWFASGEVHKEYLALVHGKCRAEGVWKRPLSDARRGKPLEAITHYKRLEHWRRYSLVHIALETGRKHQIRRHFEGEVIPLLETRGTEGNARLKKECCSSMHRFSDYPMDAATKLLSPKPFENGSSNSAVLPRDTWPLQRLRKRCPRWHSTRCPH